MISSHFILSALLMGASLTRAMPVSLVGRADGALSCYPINIDQVRKLPGWSKIEQYAKEHWGEGGVNILTNPSEYPERKADACVNQYRIPTDFSEQPQCSTSSVLVEGKVDGTTQKITFEQEIGQEESGTWTVTQSSSITAGAKFSVSVGIKGIADVSAEAWMETTITDERSQSFTTTSRNIQTTKLEHEQHSGQRCKVKLETKKCSSVYKGRVPVVATGFVWFNYDDRRAPLINPHGDGEHYKYSAHIDSILNENERTMWIDFQGPVNVQSKSMYETDCTKPENEKPPPPKENDEPKKKPGTKTDPPKVKPPKRGPTDIKDGTPKPKKPAEDDSETPAKGKPKPKPGKPTGPKPGGAKPTKGKPAAPKPGGAKPAKPAKGKPAVPKPGGAKPTKGKPAAPKPGGSRPNPRKPAAPKKGGASPKPTAPSPKNGKPAPKKPGQGGQATKPRAPAPKRPASPPPANRPVRSAPPSRSQPRPASPRKP